MMLGEWKAKLIEKPGYYGAALYLWRNTGTTTEFLQRDGTIESCVEGAASEPQAFALLDDSQLKAMAEAFSNFGVKTPNDHKAAGLLEAKENHLQDMRRLVFKSRGGVE